MNVGNRIFKKVIRPSRETVEIFRDIPSSNINDGMGRLFCMHEYIHLLNTQNAVQLLGTAITVKTPIGDNLFFHAALDIAEPGDVIVIDGGSGNNRSLAGEIMLRLAQDKGLAGLVVDGCLRDMDGIERMAMPVYAKGITPQGPYKNGPGEINVPVACGGQVVFPGDILVGDRDGIVVVRRQDAAEVAAVAAAKKQEEDELFGMMDRDSSWYIAEHVEETAARMKNKCPAIYESCYEQYI